MLEQNGYQHETSWTEAALSQVRQLAANAANAAPEDSDFDANLQAALEQQRANESMTAGDYALTAAVDDLKADPWRGARSIHEAAYAGIPDMKPADRPAEPEETFDAQKFEQAYGLPKDYLDGVKSVGEAHEALKMFFGDDVIAAQDVAKQEAALSDGVVALESRVEAQFTRWSSPKFGSGASLTAEQIRERDKLARVACAHAGALIKAGQPVPNIEALLNRARLQADADWKPSFKAPVQHRNIHAAYQSGKV